MKNSLESSLSVLSLSLFVSEAKLSDLWRLEAIGILDEEDKTRSLLGEETKKHFVETVDREEHKRYVDDSILSSSQALAERSLVG